MNHVYVLMTMDKMLVNLSVVYIPENDSFMFHLIPFLSKFGCRGQSLERLFRAHVSGLLCRN